MTAPGGGQWGDLQTRVISAVVMLAVGATEVWLGGWSFATLVVALTGLMIWELASMTAAPNPAPNPLQGPVAVACLAALALLMVLLLAWPCRTAVFLIPLAALVWPPRREPVIAGLYGAAVLAAGYGLIDLRNSAGTPAILWLILVVIASDVSGYFVGRSLGGPKFWPAISPKKTWSGTVAGWLGAMLVGLGFATFTGAGYSLVLLSPIIAFAGQMGDIAESWIKRRTGVKDSSRLIPGHGGVLDRFDALIGAVLAILALAAFWPLPFVAGH